VAERLRDAVKFKIGRRNERLVQFNIAPLRKRPRKPVVIEKEVPAGTPEMKETITNPAVILRRGTS
jgi:hypothetical protein